MPDVPRTPAAIATDPTDGTVCIWFDARQPGSMGPDPGLAGAITQPVWAGGCGLWLLAQSEGGLNGVIVLQAAAKPGPEAVRHLPQQPRGPLVTPPAPARDRG